MNVKHSTGRRPERGGQVLALTLLVASLSACRAQRRIENAPRVDDPLLAAAQASQREDWPRAAHYWNEVFVGTGGTDSEACWQTANALYKMGDCERASNVLQEGLDADPENSELLELRAESLVALGFRRSAEAYYEQCLEQDPNRISALCALGRLRLSLDREAAAVVPLQRAYDLGCHEPFVFEHLARAYRDSGQPVHAWRMLTTRMGMEPSPDPELVAEAAVLSMNPRLLAEQSDATAVAVVWLEICVNEFPDHSAAYFQHGVLSETLGNQGEAVDSYRMSIHKDPAFLPALTNLALLYAELEREGPCREMVARAIELESDRARRLALQELLVRFE